jgi:hypothetical protein
MLNLTNQSGRFQKSKLEQFEFSGLRLGRDVDYPQEWRVEDRLRQYEALFKIEQR